MKTIKKTETTQGALRARIYAASRASSLPLSIYFSLLTGSSRPSPHQEARVLQNGTLRAYQGCVRACVRAYVTCLAGWLYAITRKQ